MVYKTSSIFVRKITVFLFKKKNFLTKFNNGQCENNILAIQRHFIVCATCPRWAINDQKFKSRKILLEKLINVVLVQRVKNSIFRVCERYMKHSVR